MGNPTSATELATIDAVSQADLVRRGQLRPVDLVEAAIERIEQVDGILNAVIIRLFDKAKAVAASSDLPDGPFRGVPLLLKDAECTTAGDPYHFGMAALRRAGYIAPTDAPLAKRFRRAGFVVCGRTNTPELAASGTTEPQAYGPTRNPWDPARSPGGSSGGSAAAVAAGMVPVAHAGDALGSLRIPASACGLVGLKPSREQVSLRTGYTEVDRLGISEHVLCRTVRDCAAVLDAIASPTNRDIRMDSPSAGSYASEVGVDPGSLCIGVRENVPETGSPPHEECARGVAAATGLLERLGHRVHSSPPLALDEVVLEPLFHARWAWLARELDLWEQRLERRLTAKDVEPSTWEKAERGRGVTAPEYLAIMNHLDSFARRLISWWCEGNDILLTPTIHQPPQPIGHWAQTAESESPVVAFTAPFNVTGQPAISLPLHWTSEGLPVGVQLVAAPGREDVLIRVAAQLEQAMAPSSRIPPVHATRCDAKG